MRGGLSLGRGEKSSVRGSSLALRLVSQLYLYIFQTTLFVATCVYFVLIFITIKPFSKYPTELGWGKDSVPLSPLNWGCALV